MTDAISTYGNAECVTYLADWRRSTAREIAVVLCAATLCEEFSMTEDCAELLTGRPE